MSNPVNSPLVSDDGPALDLEVVGVLKELGGEENPELFRELVDTFAEDSPARVEAIVASAAQGDADGLRTAAHGLKSSAANMGATHLWRSCRALEELGRDGDLESARPIATAVPGLFDLALKSLQQEAAS